MYRKVTIMTQGSEISDKMSQKNKVGREAIHSGHFMVSDFEAEAQDDEDEVAVPVPEEEANKMGVVPNSSSGVIQVQTTTVKVEKPGQHLTIETSLTKLFQCMSLAYRQKLTSPKWNRFKGIRLRWKDKIRLNNVIWRCWHMQFIMKQNTLVCQFASPLDVDTHNKPEAVVLEGKYWKRKLATVTAEYKKWRMFYKNKIMGWTGKEIPDMLSEMDAFDWQPHSNDSVHSIGSMMVDEDYMDFMSDTLFSTITSNQPFAFPNPREIARGAGLADFIQPSLVQLQPNLDDFMDTLEPLQELLYSKLPSVPEESTTDDLFRNTNASQSEHGLMDEFVDLSVLGVGSASTTSSLTQGNQQMEVSRERPFQEKEYPAEAISGFGEVQIAGDGTDNFGANCIPQATFDGPASMGSSSSGSNVSYRPVVLHSPRHRMQQSRSEGTARDIMKNKIIRRVGGNSMSLNSGNNISGYRQPSTSFTGDVGVNVSVGEGSSSGACASSSSSSQSSLTGSSVGQGGMPIQRVAVDVYESKEGVIRTTPLADSSVNMKSLPRRASTPGEKEEIFVMPKYHGKPRGRWRSGSSLVTSSNSSGMSQQTSSQLVSVASDPSLSTMSPSALLTQLLTTRTHPAGGDNNPSTSSAPRQIAPHVVGMSQPPSSQATTSTPASSNTSVTTTPVPILPMPVQRPAPPHTRIGPPTTTALLITTPITMAAGIETAVPSANASLRSEAPPVQRQVVSPMVLESPESPGEGAGQRGSEFSSPAQSPSPGRQSEGNTGGPLSPPRPFRPKTDTERVHYKEHRRVCHINAEQKRRCNIKNGFDMLHSLIPQLSQNPNTKLSKAAMLQKGADYIRQLRAEREQLKNDMATLRLEIEGLNAAISNCQAMLPATGAPVSRQRAGKMRERFDEFVRVRTLQNWKFWIFSILFEPLLVSYNSSVSTASLEDLCRTTLLWVEQHCSLVDLRPAVLNSLRYLCTATEILSDPSRLPEEATRAVTSGEGNNISSRVPPRPPPVQ
ncbi:carbohydrate-responsive element-binding protein isoform X2 [Ischnura elegans]|uniref:carbohydrate-responsive element-binding protein isoform X2 n=1 Tax=Ischnura elegans TaxID=197161 RepID=UPI001ED89B2B|nr:carbohydrate-responsive element-binding protein isoform X2 [Ischnura elegans]